MNRLTRDVTVRGASLTLWVASVVVSGVSCRIDDIGQPINLSRPVDSAASLIAGITSTPALSFYQVDAAKGPHACGLTTDNRAYCWGNNRAGQLGDI